MRLDPWLVGMLQPDIQLRWRFPGPVLPTVRGRVAAVPSQLPSLLGQPTWFV